MNIVAETRFELITIRVWGESASTSVSALFKSEWRDLNPQPSRWQRNIPPIELHPQNSMASRSRTRDTQLIRLLLYTTELPPLIKLINNDIRIRLLIVNNPFL